MSEPRRRRTEAELTPEARARLEAIRARRRTPEGRAEEEAIRAAVRIEFPPLRPDPETLAILAELRRERQRQGLNLDEIAERSGILRAALGGLEDGRIPDPTIGLLRQYAAALGKVLIMTLAERQDAST